MKEYLLDEETNNKIKNNDQTTKIKNPLTQVIYLGILFLFTRSIFSSYSNMISQIYEQEGYKNLGTISVLIFFFFFGLNNILFAPLILRKISLKTALCISTFNFPILVATGVYGSGCEGIESNGCNVYLIYFVVVFFSALCGSLGAILWTAQAGYLASCSPKEKLPLYIGIFFAFAQSSQITANIFSLFILGNFTHFQYFLLLFGIAIFVWLLFFILPNVKHKKEIINLNNNANKSTSESGSNGEDLREDENELITNLKMIKEMIKKPRIRSLCGFFMTIGICIGFYTGFLYKMIQYCLPSDLSRQEINEKTSYNFIILGVFSFFGGLLCGKLVGVFKKSSLMYFSVIMLQISLLCSLMAFETKNYAWCFISSACWGFTDVFLTTLSNILVKIEMGSSLEGYGILRFCMGVGVVITSVLAIILKSYSYYYFLWIMFFLQMFSFYFVVDLKE